MVHYFHLDNAKPNLYCVLSRYYIDVFGVIYFIMDDICIVSFNRQINPDAHESNLYHDLVWKCSSLWSKLNEAELSNSSKVLIDFCHQAFPLKWVVHPGATLGQIRYLAVVWDTSIHENYAVLQNLVNPRYSFYDNILSIGKQFTCHLTIIHWLLSCMKISLICLYYVIGTRVVVHILPSVHSSAFRFIEDRWRCAHAVANVCKDMLKMIIRKRIV